MGKRNNVRNIQYNTTEKKAILWKCLLLFAIAVSLSGIVVYEAQTLLKPALERGSYKDSYADYADLQPMGELVDGMVVVQEITIQDKTLSSIDLHTIDYGKNISSTLIVSLVDSQTKETYETWKRPGNQMTKGLQERFELKTPIVCEGMKSFQLWVQTEGAQSGNAISLYRSVEDCYPGEMYLNDQKQNFDIEFILHFGKKEKGPLFESILFWCVMIGTVVFITLLTAYFLFGKEVRMERVFLACMFYFGLLYLIIMPPFSVPDEVSHYSTVYKMSNQLLHKDVDGARACDSALRYSNYLDMSAYHTTLSDLFKKESTTFNAKMPVALYNPTKSIQYTPQVLGVTFARILHLNYVWMVYMGQLFNLLFFILCGYFAVKIIPFGKAAVTSVALLPMLLSLITSYSYDAVINALLILFTSYVFYLAYGKEKVTWKDLLILLGIYLLIVPCKLVYSTVGLLIFCIPYKKVQIHLKKWVWAVLLVVGVVGVAVVLKSVWPMISQMLLKDKNIIYDGSEGYTLKAILSNPRQSLWFFYFNLKANGGRYLAEMLGFALGWLNVYVPLKVIIGFAICLLCSVLFCRTGEYRENWVRRVLLLFSMLFAGGMIILVMWISWTPLSSPIVQGVQGRYFLPVLLPGLLVLYNDRFMKKINLTKVVIGAECVLQMFVIVAIFAHGFFS